MQYVESDERIKYGAVIDRTSLVTSETSALLNQVPVGSMSGRLYLFHALQGGMNNAEMATWQQEAVQELGENHSLSDQLKGSLVVIGETENGLDNFLEKDNRSHIYRSARKWGEAVVSISDSLCSEVGNDSSPYLQTMKKIFGDYKETRLAPLLKGPDYFTPRGLKGRDEIGPFYPRIRFREGLSGRVLVSVAATIALVSEGVVPRELLLGDYGVGMIAVMINAPARDYSTVKDEIWNLPTVYRKLRKLSQATPEFNYAKLSLGILDALRSFAEMRQTFTDNGHTTVFPQLSENQNYSFEAESLKNPLICLRAGKAVVGNNIAIGCGDSRLTFLTGPNSGGKSTLSKAIVQNQALAQLGAPIVASSATINMSDRIAYHAPMPPDLEDETGRFGHELGRVRTILDSVSLESLAILDDCLDGTTHEERVSVLKNVMEGFRNLCGSTLFSTHAHELVDQFVGQADTQFLQVEFADDKPTYNLIEGISHTSHADKVAELHGFGPEQIAEEVSRRLKATQTANT